MLFNTKDSSTLIGAIAQTRQNKLDAAAYQRVYSGISQAQDSQSAFLGMNIDTAKDMSDQVKSNLKET